MDLFLVDAPEDNTVRMYKAESQEEANRLYDTMAPYEAQVRVVWITPQTVMLKGMRSDMTLGKRIFTRLAGLLHARGIHYVIAQRAPGRRMPWGTMIDSGPLAGCWYTETAPILGGADGNY